MKKIKYFWTCLLLISFVAIAGSVLMLVGQFTSSCSQQPTEEKFVNDPILEQKYINYRIEFVKKWYELAKLETNNRKDLYPNGWLPEYDDILKENAIDPKIGIDTRLEWWANYIPFIHYDNTLSFEHTFPPDEKHKVVYFEPENGCTGYWKTYDNYYELTGFHMYISEIFWWKKVNGSVRQEKLLTYTGGITIRIDKQ